MKRWSGRRAAAALLVATASGLGGLAPGAEPTLVTRALAAEAWRAEFDAICAKTQDAMALPLDELKSLVARSDQLLPELEKLETSQRKVYVKRLQGCRNLYAFVLESRQKGS